MSAAAAPVTGPVEVALPVSADVFDLTEPARPMRLWRHQVTRCVAGQPELKLPVPLPWDDVVTTVVTVGGRPEWQKTEGFNVHNWQESTIETMFSWRLEDSLDGMYWFPLASGVVWLDEVSNIVRVSAPAGNRVRLRGSVTLIDVMRASGKHSSSVVSSKVADLGVRDLEVSVAVRCLPGPASK